MGNQLKKEYDVNLENQCGSGGLGLCWKLYSATDLKTKEEVTIFTFSKKELPKILRKDNDRFINLLKKEVERGYKFKHPNCLSIIKPIREFRGELAFVTERVMCSLSNILGNTTQLTSQHNTFNLSQKIINFKFGELQIRSGLSQLCDATQFIHNDAHMAHGFIHPANIYITETGDWKLFGFEFASHVATENDESRLEWDFTNEKELVYYPPFLCLAPEIMISNILTVKSDVFSIGRIAYILHRHHAGIRAENVILTADAYRRFINNLNISNTPHLSNSKYSIPFEGIPNILISTLKNTLKTDEKLRCKLIDIINCKYLNDMIVRVIRYLEKLLEKEEDGKIKFLKKLPEVISQFDEQTLIHKVVPPLMIQLQDERIINNVLPSLIKITEILSSTQYQTLIEPILQRYFISTDLPQVFYILINNVVLLCSKSTIENRRDLLMPMILKGLGIRNVAIQTNLLKNIPEIVNKQYIEWKDLRNKILPKLKEICNLSVAQNHKITPLRVNVLMCLAKIFSKFDSDVIIGVILNECVWKILSKTKETAILMSVLGVCDAIAKHVGPMIIANDILPHIIPLLMQENLNIKQYNTFIKCIRYMIDKIDRYKINQINRIPNTNTLKKLGTDKNETTSMSDILEKEFDPNKKGEIYKENDDPFVPKPNDITSVSSGSNSNKNLTGNVFEKDVNNTYESEVKKDENNNYNNKGGFSGFDDGGMVKESKVIVPPVYGTKNAIIGNTKDNVEAFGWNSNKEKEEENNLFVGGNNSNISSGNNNENVSAFGVSVVPFSGGNINNNNNSNENINNNKPKRRVRSKGKIKKNTSAAVTNNSPNSTGFVGFGNNNNNNSNESSAFGFMNESNYTTTTTTTATATATNVNMFGNNNNANVNMFGGNNNSNELKSKPKPAPIFSGSVENDDMFGGMQTNFSKKEDPFAGLGHGHNSQQKQTNISIKKENNNKVSVNSNSAQSGFDFMNQNNNNNNNSSNNAQIFQGFGGGGGGGVTGINNNNNNNIQKQSNNNDDPFAGLF